MVRSEEGTEKRWVNKGFYRQQVEVDDTYEVNTEWRFCATTKDIGTVWCRKVAVVKQIITSRTDFRPMPDVPTVILSTEYATLLQLQDGLRKVFYDGWAE